MISKLLLPLLSIFFCLASHAQANYEPGYIILKNGDRKNGWINYQNWSRNPRKIEFKEVKEGPSSLYSFTDLQAFEVAGKDRYDVYTVSKIVAPADINDLQQSNTAETVTDTVFLRVLIRGDKLNLYELVDERKHYYIQQPQNAPVELQYKLIKKEGNFFIKQTTYREQLKVLTENKNLQSKIDQADYISKDITRIVKQINGSIIYLAPDVLNNKGNIHFFIGAGGTSNTLDVSGDNKTLSDMNFQGSTSYILTTGIDLLGKRNLNNLRLRFEVSYAPATYNGKITEPGAFVGQQEQKEYSIKQANIIPAFSVLYSFFRSKTLQVFAGAAAAQYFTSYSDNTLTITNLTTGAVEKRNNYLDLSKNWLAVQLKGGIRINHFEVMLTGKLSGSFFDFYGIKGNVGNYSLRVHYML